MAASSSSPPASKSRRPGWRYSLRALLILLTLVCVGLSYWHWYWFRVPYVTEIRHDEPFEVYIRANASVVGNGRFMYYGPNGTCTAVKEVRRYRRVLDGDLIQEGEADFFDKSGRQVGREHWRNGKLHGPRTLWYPSGTVREQGAYHRGKKTGNWDVYEPEHHLRLRMPYEQDWRHGDAQWFANGKVIRTVRYDHGEVTHIDGRAVDDPLGRARREGRLDNEYIAQALDQAPPELVSFLLYRCEGQHRSFFTGKRHSDPSAKLEVRLDRRALVEGRMPSLTHKRLELKADIGITSHLALILLLEPHGLVATYRFGVVWITTKDNARNWFDRTGVSELLSGPPTEASPGDIEWMRKLLSSPAEFAFFNVSIKEVAQSLSDKYSAPFVCDASAKDRSVHFQLYDTNLERALAIFCDQHNLRVRRKENRFVIEALEPVFELRARPYGAR